MTSNNFLGSSANCGVLNESGVPLVVAGNYRGSASGPGPAPADGVIEVDDVDDLVVVSNNFLGNGTDGTNCAVSNFTLPGAGGFPSVSDNYWRSETGPGPDPGDAVCGFALATTPFLRAPVPVTTTTGR